MSASPEPTIPPPPATTASDSPPPGTPGLGGASSRGALLTLSAQGVRFALGLGGTVLLARWVAPREFGLVAGVSAALGLFGALRELGLGAATVQRADVDPAQTSALFWIHLGVGMASWALLAAAAPALGWLLDEPRAAGLAAALAATLPLAALGTQPRALLQRRLAFGALARCDVAALALGTASACAAALLGAGAWALVAGPLVAEAAAAATLWRAARFRPGPPRRGAGVRGLLRFGGHVTLATALQQVSRHLDKLLVGACFGATALGFYGRAHHVALLPFAQIHAPLGSVAVPALARLQREPARFRVAYLRALRLTVLAGLPVMAAIGVLARDLVWVVLGEDWLPAVPLLAVFACAAYGQVIGNPAGWLFVALGHTREMLRWTLLASGSLALAFAAGLPFGPLGVAVAYALCLALLRVPHFALALRGAPVSGADVWHTVRGAVAVSTGAALVMLGVREALPDAAPAARLLAALAAGGLANAAGALLWAPARGDLAHVLETVRERSAPGLAGLRAAESRS